MQERALAIKERAYGRDHTDVAITLMNLGTTYGSLGDNAKERDLLERALTIFERAYGRDHADVAVTLMNLGGAYGALGDHAKKRDMLERALAIQERAYGRDHVQVAATLTNLGVAHMKLDATDKARDYVERASAIFERAFGPDHDNSKMCQSILTRLSRLPRPGEMIVPDTQMTLAAMIDAQMAEDMATLNNSPRPTSSSTCTLM